MERRCPDNVRAVCPLAQANHCFSDTHHLQYPRSAHHGQFEREWRNEPFNKVELPRCLHNAIHASGYIPEKPDRQTMVIEHDTGTSIRSMHEREYQIGLGYAALRAVIEQDGGDAA